MLRADLEVSTGVYETIKTYSKIVFEDSLNGVTYFDIVLEGNGLTYRNTYATGKSIFIYKDSTLLCKGVILRRGFTSNGQLRLEGTGKPEWHLKVAAPSKNWTSTNTSGVISGSGNLLSRTTYVTAGTIQNQTVSSFRSKEDETVLQAVTRLAKLTGQDYYFNYSAMTLNVVDHRGSTTSVATFVDGVDIKGVVVNEDDYEVIKKVIVIGKGYGANQIVGSYSSGWVQGDQEKVIIDKAVDSTTEGNNLAQKYYNIYSQNRVDYTFEYIGVSDFTTGDVITMNSDVAGVYDTNLRITKQKFVSTKDEEKIYLTVRGTGERENADDYLKKMLENKKANAELASMGQPTDNAYTNISITGSVLSAPSNTDINGAVSTAGSGDTGYYLGVYTRNLINDASWRSVGTSVDVGSGTFMFHGVWATFRISSIATVQPQIDIRIRVYNTTDDTYYPSGGGYIQLNFPGSTITVDHNHTVNVGGTNYTTTSVDTEFWHKIIVPFYLHIPMNWTNKNYILQYYLDINTTLYTSYLDYSYHGNEGHTHGDSFGTDDYNHGHGDDISNSDPGHHN